MSCCWRQAGARAELAQHVGPERLAEMRGVDRLIGAVADPGIDLGPAPALRQLADETAQGRRAVRRRRESRRRRRLRSRARGRALARRRARALPPKK